MAQTQAQVLALQKETYRTIIPMLFEDNDAAYARIKSKNVEKAGPRTLVLPKLIRPGGQFRYWNPDGGDMGRGSGDQYEKCNATPLFVLEAIETNKAVEYNTANAEIAVENAVKQSVSRAMDEINLQHDKALQTAGDGVYGTVAAAGPTGAVVPFDPPFGPRLLRIGTRYNWYDASLAGMRTGGGLYPSTLLKVDYVTGIATFDQVPSDMVATDVIVPEGLSGATPTSIYGFPYHFSSASTGSYMGLSRVTYPELRTPALTVSAALTLAPLRQIQNMIEMLRPNAFSTGQWEVYWHPAQSQTYEALGIQVTEWEKSGGNDAYDGLFDKKKLRVGGFRQLESNNANPTRIDFTDWKNWGWAETLPVGMYDVGDLTTFPIYGASGGLAAASIFYIVHGCQTFVDDPQRGGYLASLTKPAGYPY